MIYINNKCTYDFSSTKKMDFQHNIILGAQLAFFYERAGHICCQGNSVHEGTVSIVEAVDSRR